MGCGDRWTSITHCGWMFGFIHLYWEIKCLGCVPSVQSHSDKFKWIMRQMISISFVLHLGFMIRTFIFIVITFIDIADILHCTHNQGCEQWMASNILIHTMADNQVKTGCSECRIATNKVFWETTIIYFLFFRIVQEYTIHNKSDIPLFYITTKSFPQEVF